MITDACCPDVGSLQRVTLYSVARPEQQHFKSLFLALLVEHGPLNTILSKCNNYLVRLSGDNCAICFSFAR